MGQFEKIAAIEAFAETKGLPEWTMLKRFIKGLQI